MIPGLFWAVLWGFGLSFVAFLIGYRIGKRKKKKPCSGEGCCKDKQPQKENYWQWAQQAHPTGEPPP